MTTLAAATAGIPEVEIILTSTRTPIIVIEFTATPSSTPQSTITYTPQPTPEVDSIGSFLPAQIKGKTQTEEILAIDIAPDGVLWIRTGQGLASLSNQTWSRHPGIGDRILGFDALNRTWAIDKDGDSIAAWDGKDWAIFGAERGWTSVGIVVPSGPYSNVSDPVTDERGWIWLATSRDVRMFDGQTWQIYLPEEVGFIPSQQMIEQGFGFSPADMDIDSVGDVWVTDCAWMGPGPQGQGARWFDGETWAGAQSQVVGSGCIEDIEVDPAGHIWVGVDENLWCYSPGAGWRLFSPPDPDPAWGHRWGWISEIEIGGEGIVWVTLAPCGGASCDTGYYYLYRVVDSEWTLISEAESIDMALGQTGDGWLCVGDGLFRVQGIYLELEYQLEDFRCIVEIDGSGKAWLAIPGQPGLWFFDESQSD